MNGDPAWLSQGVAAGMTETEIKQEQLIQEALDKGITSVDKED